MRRTPAAVPPAGGPGATGGAAAAVRCGRPPRAGTKGPPVIGPGVITPARELRCRDPRRRKLARPPAGGCCGGCLREGYGRLAARSLRATLRIVSGALVRADSTWYHTPLR